MKIRLATKKDQEAVWKIFRRVIQTGDTYVFDPNTKRENLENHWFAPYMKTFVAEENSKILGTYILKPNQIDLGSHIANCSYMVLPEAQGKGIGRKMCEHSLILAKEIGYTAMQYNIVVSTNLHAIKLWKDFGFRIIGTIPKGFQHKKLGLVDAFIMFREL